LWPCVLGLAKSEEGSKSAADADTFGSTELDAQRVFVEGHYKDKHPNVLLWGAGKVRPTLIVRYFGVTTLRCTVAIVPD
jgi:hypothetical protein